MEYLFNNMDKKDAKILKVLKENAKLSTQQISKKTLIPITTVHHRIKKMEKEGVINGYTTIVDNKKIGKNIAAYVLVAVDYKLLKEKRISQHELAEKLKKHEIVEEVAMLTGVTDIILKIRVKDINELNGFVTRQLRNMDGIENTKTMVVLHEF